MFLTRAQRIAVWITLTAQVYGFALATTATVALVVLAVKA